MKDRSQLGSSVARWGVGLVVVGCGLVLAGFVIPRSELWAAVGCGLLPAALALLGLSSTWGRLRRIEQAVLGGVLAAVAGGPAAVVWSTGYWVEAGGAWWLGLPMPTALLVFGVGLGSLVVTGVAYAWVFDRVGVRDEDLERLERNRP